MNIDWISVKDTRQPELATRYLVKNEFGVMYISRKTVKGWLNVDSIPITGVTHWAVVHGPSGEILL